MSLARHARMLDHTAPVIFAGPRVPQIRTAQSDPRTLDAVEMPRAFVERDLKLISLIAGIFLTLLLAFFA